jgi:hypothetical protein
MFRRDIIEKIIKQRGDWELVDENDIDILYSETEKNNYETIALYRLDINGDHPFKLINKKEYQSYIRDEQINKILE